MAEVLALTEPACAFRHNDERCTWIDTGVVVFLPLAAGTLQALFPYPHRPPVLVSVSRPRCPARPRTV